MKIMAINGSPRGANGNTAVMLNALLAGFSQNGDQTTVVTLAEKTINQCRGCFTCWEKTPGICVQSDDMADIIREMQAADIFVIGTPLYFLNVSGTLKVFFDRLVATGGQAQKSRPEGSAAVPGYIMVSNCGFPVRGQFDVVSLWIKRVAAMLKARLIAEFYTAGGRALTHPTDEQKRAREAYIAYLTDCGMNISRQGTLSVDNIRLLEKNINDF